MNESLRTPPYSEEAERGVLGSILLDPINAINKAKDIGVKPEWFYDRRNALLFGNLIQMDSDRSDAITIADKLKDSGNLERIGGYEYLIELQDDTIVPGHLSHYSQIVKDKYLYRRQIEICSAAIDRAYRCESVPEDVISSMMDLDQRDDRLMTDEQIVENWRNAMDGKYATVPLPFDRVNHFMGGIRIGMNTILCGRSGSGKSMFLANWYVFLGKLGVPILVFPFEDQFEVTKTRMAASLGGYNWAKLQNGGEYVTYNGERKWVKSTEADIHKGKECLERINLMPVYFDQMRGTVNDVRERVVRSKAKHGIKAAFFDGFKDFSRPSGTYSDVGGDEELSQKISDMASKEDIATVTIHHLTKVPDGDAITPLNIRGSGNLVSDARAVLALQNSGFEQLGVLDYDEDTRVLDLIKSNHSRLGRLKLTADLAKCRYYDATDKGE